MFLAGKEELLTVTTFYKPKMQMVKCLKRFFYCISDENYFQKKTNTVTLLRKENTICRVTDNLIKGDGCCHTPAQLLAPKAFWSLKMATMLTRHTRRFQWNSDHSWIKKKIQIPKSRKYRCFGIQTGSWTS